MILIIGFMFLLISVEVLLLSIYSKLDKIMISLELNNKSKKKIKMDKEIEKIRKEFL